MSAETDLPVRWRASGESARTTDHLRRGFGGQAAFADATAAKAVLRHEGAASGETKVRDDGPGENIAWAVKLAGAGSSSPIIWDDQVIVTSQVGRAAVKPGAHPGLARENPELVAREKPIGGARGEADTQIALAVESFSRVTGRRLWEHRLAAVGPFPELHEKHNLASPTAVTDGERIYAWFGTGQLVALDMRGRVVWTRHLGAEYSPFDINWGHGSSPVLYKELIVLLCDHTSASYLLALDKRTGKERWKADRGSGRASYATPIVVVQGLKTLLHNGREGLKGPLLQASPRDELVINSSQRVDAYDPATGELLWHADGPRQTPVPSPVLHDNIIYMSRGYRGSPVLAIRPGGRGNVSDTHVAWRMPTGASYASSIVYYDGLLYMTNDVGVLTVADAKTGERVTQARLDGVFFASPVAGDGKVYFASETGETFVIRAGRAPEILARNDVGERLIASPAISKGQIFLRSDGRLFCVGGKGAGSH